MRSRSALGILIAVLSIAAATTYFRYQRTPAPVIHGPLLVEARGHGRAWRFTYSGPDQILGTSDDRVNEEHLILPEGAEVVVQLRSDDFIYVFSCPDLKLKEIAVPDLEFSIAFQTPHPSTHDLAMDPMCGFLLSPSETMGTLRVISQNDFRKWLEKRH
ncbi:MAG: heme/copper-type cytochrome/quinol oxidase subunit 2 [Verrucomicrobiales bacterium]|jgi:heme/copper-type cytochrome/quinol oxidase subunit 2